jgi:hypothetical protein
MADYLSRLDFVVLDELGYLPFAQTASCSTQPIATTSASRPSYCSPICASMRASVWAHLIECRNSFIAKCDKLGQIPLYRDPSVFLRFQLSNVLCGDGLKRTI